MIYSGVGGQMDCASPIALASFVSTLTPSVIRGAALSEGGKPIIALPSTTSKGTSKIVPFLNRGAGTRICHCSYPCPYALSQAS